MNDYFYHFENYSSQEREQVVLGNPGTTLSVTELLPVAPASFAFGTLSVHILYPYILFFQIKVLCPLPVLSTVNRGPNPLLSLSLSHTHTNTRTHTHTQRHAQLDDCIYLRLYINIRCLCGI